MKPLISSAGNGGIRLALLLALGACNDEFPTDAPIPSSPTPPAFGQWPTMMVRDTDTIAVQFSTPSGSVAGMDIRWTSSNPALLELRTIPPQGTTRADSLEARMRVQAIAHRHGSVVLTATTNQPGVAVSAVEDTVAIRERWIAVTAGGGYTCGLTVDHDAYCWGGIPTGVTPPSWGLGNGMSTGSARPLAVSGGLKFASISAGDDQTCGVTSPVGLLYCWGRNRWGELGDGSLDHSLIPALVVGGRGFAQVSTKTGLTCGVIGSIDIERYPHSQNAVCWGRASLGEIGEENASFPEANFSILCSEGPYTFHCIPKPVYTVSFPVSEDFVVRTVSVGGDFACAIGEALGRLTEGSVWCWGLNNVGQLGMDSVAEFCSLEGDDTQDFPPAPVSCRSNPVKLSEDLSFSSLSSGGRHSCGVSSAQEVYCWGGTYGPAPVVVPGPGQVDSLSVGGSLNSGLSHACALAAQGQAYCWGDNVDGELGNGELPAGGTNMPHPEMQKVLQDTLVFVAISASKVSVHSREDAAHTCGLTRDGAIYCWGDNSQGALGVPDLARVAIPTRIAEPAP
jgi:hypothetical protein